MIGIFDSGVGGLCALREARRRLPDCDFLYFGDTGRLPYGTRSPDTVIRYSMQALRFLRAQGAERALAACGTVSSVALGRLERARILPVSGVVEPAVRAALRATRNRRVAVLGTAATIESGSFERALRRHGVLTAGVACPLFVALAENGLTDPRDAAVRSLAARYLAPLRGFGADTVILGCTHFPLLRRAIGAALPGVTLIDSAREASCYLAGHCDAPTERGRVYCFVSDAPRAFERVASLFLGGDFPVHAEQIDIERY